MVARFFCGVDVSNSYTIQVIIPALDLMDIEV